MAILKPTLSGDYLSTLFIKDPDFEGHIEDNVLYIRQIRHFKTDTKWCDLNMGLWCDYDIDTLVIEKNNFNHTNQIMYIETPEMVSNVRILNKNKDWDVILADVRKMEGAIELENISISYKEPIKFTVSDGWVNGSFLRFNKLLESIQSIKGKGIYGIRVSINQWDNFKKVIGKEKDIFNITNMTHIPLTGYDITGKLQHLIIKI